ncbi:MAG: hypothetical protein U1E98_05160 [Moraxella osloensis]
MAEKKIALKSAWQSIIPILPTTLLLLALLPWVLKRVLRPIQILAKQMAKRHGQDLSSQATHRQPTSLNSAQRADALGH